MKQNISILTNIMEQAFIIEKKENYKVAVCFLECAIKEYPNLEIDLTYECAMLYFRNEEYFMALKILIDLYKISKIEAIKQFIYDAYINPNIQEYKINYERNRQLFVNYEYLYCDELSRFDEINLDLVWYDKHIIIYFKDDIFYEYTLEEFQENVNEEILILFNMMFTDDILNYETMSNIEVNNIDSIVTQTIPMYVCYSNDLFKIFLCITEDNLIKVLDKKRVVFIENKNNLNLFFDDIQAIFPTTFIWNIFDKEMVTCIRELAEKRILLIQKYENNKIEKIEKFYEKEKDNIRDHIRAGKFKMLFLTSKYTTALQFHSKNLYLAAKKIGLDCCYLIEKSDVHRVGELVLWKTIDDFRPDVIVLMDHFRFEIFNKPTLLESAVVLTWVQDPMPHIMDPDSPRKLLQRDFILNHYISWDKFWEVGYDRNKIISAPIPANQDIYKKYELSEEEKARYQSDICFVCHAADINNYIEEVVSALENKEWQSAVKNMMLSYHKRVNEGAENFYTREENEQYIIQYFREVYDIKLDTDTIISNYLTDKVYMWLDQRVYRQALVDWLIEAGYTNIKLWGNGWRLEEKYKPYAMGIAENGEELSKILQSSKIVLGNNMYSSAAARAWETMLSGGFYLCNYIPLKGDWIDIRKILNEDEIIMFHGKDDLIQKVDFYLTHEEERQRMVKIGYEAALKSMTFDILMERVMNELKMKVD